jgi:hypothetical protein
VTHDELLTEINKELEITHWEGWHEGARALRAVVELHKPVIYINLRGAECRDCDTPYPCPTIQAIEKELS